ncbi:MAG TPA: cyclopropane-fatty-acyl-phospholipid synthase family protein [Methylophilaceae bacterium]|nr:cyclopropane-fatty-acyl-phospholipid synthase family protein [Methylophilaceae bacterium]
MVTLLHRSEQAHDDSHVASRMLRRLLRGYPTALVVHLWDGRTLHIGEGSPAFTLSLQHPGVLRDLVLYRDPVRLAEAYCSGEVDVTGNFDAAVNLRYYLERLQLTFRERLLLAWRAFGLGSAERQLAREAAAASHLRHNSSESIAFHYDLSNAFYRLWLDERMVYSCAYFETPEQSLELAQRNKLDHICRKLRLRPGESLLDVGCGWGALVCWAARHYGVRAHGITLSRNQFEHAQEEVRRQGLEAQVTIELRDYRHLPAEACYDKVVSVGMFEHVGLKNLPGYFATVRRILKPDGLFLNHGITSDEPGWKRSVSSKFVNRHVFPDGELDTVSNIQGVMEDSGFEIFDVEGLRPHYALTLRHWVDRLDAKREAAVRLVGERNYRVWRLYMTASAQQFENGATGIYQILAARKESRPPPLPLTRRDLYPGN